MDLEQLTLILDTIQSMGGDAKEFGIWWMVCTTLPGLIADVLLFVFGCLALATAYRVIAAIKNGVVTSEKHAADLRDNRVREEKLLPARNET